MFSPHSLTLAHLLFIITHPFLRECSFHHMPMHLAIQCVSHSYFTFLGLHQFITFILGSLTFKRMLDFWLHTYKPWGFIRSLSKWFLFTQDYPRLCGTRLRHLEDLPRYWFLSLEAALIKYLFTYDLCVNTELSKGTRFSILWTHFILF